MASRGKSLVVGAVAASTALIGISAGTAQAAPASGCTPNVGNSGLSAAVVAHAGQRIVHRSIDATGCDIGIYVGHGASDVLIRSVWVHGANFQGIFAEKTWNLTVEHSLVNNNGFHTIDPSAPPLPGSGVHSFVGQAFAISVFGVQHAMVSDNVVFHNGRGGIGIMDNGPNDPGIMMDKQNPSAPVIGSSYVRVTGNRTWANYNGCGLVAATQNLGGNLSHLTLSGNRIAGTGMSSTNGPDIGGIVVAADLPNSWVRDVSVHGNRVTNSAEGGVILNAEAPNSWTKDVWITGNRVSGNNWAHLEAPNTAGVLVFAGPGAPGMKAAANRHTVIARNTITKQFYGIWSMGHYRPTIYGNHISVTKGGDPIFFG
ncbi:MAG TPA: right-handed parallel beta-helix repeat-containing protein [Segeticoccus sp.]|uniref:right-handed parallel beta-helix repeat-containing protein n=1 Tax=Segeticoccus sp. TaxID=2706531 RepID=UPI002D7F1A8F|nr:right-handed parallel beta-helix repeat-containing protein [Segeticoccus sp.]HET8601705.1 right-handed parallel beta-helix repeat-containing protein [Segeticoccus sp.]